jgi:hypothetical protein
LLYWFKSQFSSQFSFALYDSFQDPILIVLLEPILIVLPLIQEPNSHCSSGANSHCSTIDSRTKFSFFLLEPILICTYWFKSHPHYTDIIVSRSNSHQTAQCAWTTRRITSLRKRHCYHNLFPCFLTCCHWSCRSSHTRCPGSTIFADDNWNKSDDADTTSISNGKGCRKTNF